MKKFLSLMLVMLLVFLLLACEDKTNSKTFCWKCCAYNDELAQTCYNCGTSLIKNEVTDEVKPTDYVPLNFKPYTIGVLSDIHISVSKNDDTGSKTDFARALSYYKSQKMLMVLAAGDLTVNGTDEEFAEYKKIRDKSGMAFFEVTGNHEASSERTYKSKITDEKCIAYNLYNLIGKDFCYYLKGDKYVGLRFTLGTDGTLNQSLVECKSGVNISEGDVYIFVGILGDINNGLFFLEEIQWLKDTLEENRNNRCFVIEHCRAERLLYNSEQGKYIEDQYADYVSGNYGSKYIKSLWGQSDNNVNGKYARCFEELMSHYTNCIWIHGHTHMSAKNSFNAKETPYLYDKYFGDAFNPWNFTASEKNKNYSYSIHISSCAEPRNETGENPTGSEGCIFNVNLNEITVTYIDFTNNTIIEEYTIPTSRSVITGGTFKDPNGLIK